MRAEGVVSGSPMWRLGTLRTELLHMIGERLRHVFNSDVQASAGGEKLWASTGLPDTMQLTKIPAQQKLANHWDRRDRWQEARAASLCSAKPPSDLTCTHASVFGAVQGAYVTGYHVQVLPMRPTNRGERQLE